MNSQSLYHIVFSEDRSYRLKRHLIFWLAVFLYHLVRISMIYPPGKIWESRWSLLEMAFYWGFIINTLFTYTVVYYLIPKYFRKRKYFHFTSGLLLMFIILLSVNYLHLSFVNRSFRNASGMFSIPDFIAIIRGQVIRFLVTLR